MKIHKFKQRLVRSLILVAAVVGTVTIFTNLSFTGGQTVASAADSILTYNASTKTLTVGPGDINYGFNEITEVEEAEKIIFVQSADSTDKVVAPEYSYRLFYNLTNLKQMIGLRNLDTSQVTNMSYMFNGCDRLAQIDLSGFNTSKVINMNDMFRNCTSLTQVDLSAFESVPTLTTMEMFKNTPALWKITLGPNFVFTANSYVVSGLQDPVEGTTFNHVLKVNSTKWLHKTGGSELNPTGDYERTAVEIKSDHVLGATDTYVWQGDLGNTTVEYVVQPTYTITILATITIPSATVAGTGDVTLSAYPKVPYEERFIHISATSGITNWHLTTTGDATGAEYDFSAEGGDVNLKTGDDLVIEADGEAPATVKTISASLTDNTHEFKYAGTYMDTVTFTIETAAS